ncbi:type IV secretory system conjugative DNA transfer family protein [Yersinia enterocolitica]
MNLLRSAVRFVLSLRQLSQVYDIRRSKVVTWGDDSKGGVIIGLHKGKLLRYIAPDFISMGAGTRAGKGAAVVIDLDKPFSINN